MTDVYFYSQTIALLAANSALFHLKVGNEGLIAVVIIVVGRFFIAIMMISTFSFIYLCYYIIAYYIHLIILDLKRPFRLPPTKNVPNGKQLVWYVRI